MTSNLQGQNLIFLAILVLAVPTTITDYYYAGRVSDGTHQLVVHPEDEKAANWACSPDGVERNPGM